MRKEKLYVVLTVFSCLSQLPFEEGLTLYRLFDLARPSQQLVCLSVEKLDADVVYTFVGLREFSLPIL